MAGRQKHTKKPQYAAAFEQFCRDVPIPDIARSTGLDPEQLATCALRSDWAGKRARIAGQNAVIAAESRIQAQIAVDSTLVNATQSAASTLATAYVRLIEEAAALPTHPFAPADGSAIDATERYRQERAMIEAKASTMRLATNGLRELIETAQGVGLLKVERGGKVPDGGDDRDRPIDLAKLTQLNIAIVQATNGRTQVLAQLAEPAPNGEPVNVTANAT